MRRLIPLRALPAIFALLILATPLDAQLRGRELYDAMGSGRLVSIEGVTRVSWLPDGDYYTVEQRQGGREFLRVDPRTGEEEPLLDAATTSAIVDGYARLTGQEPRGIPFSRLQYVMGSEALYFETSEGHFLFELDSRNLRKLNRPVWDLSQETEGLMRRLAGSQLAQGTYSDDYTQFARVIDYDIYVTNTATGEERRVTFGGEEGIMNGRPDWLYPEELGQSEGYWWSPDGSRIAYLQWDEREVFQFPIVHDLEPEARLELQRYVKAGETNPTVRLFVADVATGESVEVDTNSTDQVYIVRVEWVPDGSEVTFQRLNRRQNVLELMAADPSTGAVRTILTEREDAFVNLTDDLTFLEGGRFLWTSERTGWRHVYLYDLEGTLIRQLTDGEWPVSRISAVNEESGWVYLTGDTNNALETHLFRVRLDGSGFRRLTEEAGSHNTSVNPVGTYYTDTYSSLTRPSVTRMHAGDGEVTRTLATSDTEELDALELEPPELVTVMAADGVTPLNGILYKPAGYDPNTAYPLLVSVYGGPSGASIRDRFQTDGGSQRMAQLGYMVWRMDNRGTGNRGKAFETVTHLKLGQVDLADQAAGVRQITQRPYIDGSRVGIYGGSYGGYMSALALLKEPDVFHVGVAGSSVTDWRNYDSAYTERYMWIPQENEEGYDLGSCLNYAENLEGHLLLTHGTTDNNVHPGNTIQLVEALIRAGKTFDLMLYPQQRHGIGGAGRMHVSQLRMDYFERHLNPQPVGG